jgi:hypothetical protein
MEAGGGATGRGWVAEGQRKRFRLAWEKVSAASLAVHEPFFYLAVVLLVNFLVKESIFLVD